MTEQKKSTPLGRFLPLALVISDFVLVNLVFTFVTHICPPLAHHTGSGLMYALVNLALLPVALWELSGRNARAILLDLTVINAGKAVLVHLLFLLALIAVTGRVINMHSMLVFYGVLILALPFWRLVNRHLVKRVRRHGRNSNNVVIVGTNQTARRLYDEMLSDPGFGYRVRGFFDTDTPQDFDFTYLGNLDDFCDYVKTHQVDEVYFTLSGSREKELSQTVKVADDNFITFYYVPQISKYISRGFTIDNISSVPVLCQVNNPLGHPLNRAFKRSFDLLFSSAFLIVSPLIFIPVAIGVKMSSPGPVFFKQLRSGYRGRTFKCWKFRTMRVNDDADKAQATANDSRKTKFGDFLRRTSIDELPQFINVWLGDMSVVGPRPHMLKHTEDYSQIISHYMVRHLVKPGITGWAQVCGYRGLTDEVWKMEKRVEHDVWYIEHWNSVLDLKIIARTVLNAVRGEDNAF